MYATLTLSFSYFHMQNQVLVFCDDSEARGKECLQVIRNIAPSYRGNFLFVSVSHQELHLYHTFGVKIGAESAVQIVVLNITDEHEVEKFVLDHEAYASMHVSKTGQGDGDDDVSTEGEALSTELTEEKLNIFLWMYLSGDLYPSYRSEENAPITDDEAPTDETSSLSESNTASTISEERGGDTEKQQQRQDLLPVHVTSLTLKDKVVHNPESVLLFITAPW